MVDSTNAMVAEACTSEQCEENLPANSAAARKFIEDMELSMANQEHMRLLVFLSRLCHLYTLQLAAVYFYIVIAT